MTENMICSWSFGLWPWMISILSLWLESQKHRNQEQKSEHRKSCVAAKLVTEYVLSAFPIYFINAYQEFKQFACVLQIAELTHLNISSGWASCCYPVSLKEMAGVLCPQQSDSTLPGKPGQCFALGEPMSVPWVFFQMYPAVLEAAWCRGSKAAGAWGQEPPVPTCCNSCPPSL